MKPNWIFIFTNFIVIILQV